jgi:hypothetical protein
MLWIRCGSAAECQGPAGLVLESRELAMHERPLEYVK